MHAPYDQASASTVADTGVCKGLRQPSRNAATWSIGGICALAAIGHGEHRWARDRASPQQAAKTARRFKRKSASR